MLRLIKIKVKFVRKIYANDQGFSVYGAKPVERNKEIELNKYNNITISGDYSIDESDFDKKTFTVSIEPDLKAKYDGSYKMGTIHYEFPEDAKSQWQFLFESNITTPMRVSALEHHFKKSEKILDIILTEPERVAKVSGFGEKTTKKLKEKLINERDKAAVYQAFGRIDGVGPAVIQGIINYGSNIQETIQAVKKDPFILLGLNRIGFMLLDNIRAAEGIPIDDKGRCLHGVKYYITDTFNSTGNTYADLNEEIYPLAEKLMVSVNILINHIKAEMEEKNSKYGLKTFSHYITTQVLFEAEQLINKKVKYLKAHKENILPEDVWSKKIDNAISGTGITLSEEQRNFLELVNKERILLLVGPGGSGKSWVTKLAVDLISDEDLHAGLYAPTARAAKVMTGYIERPASTIHRGLLKFTFSGDYSEDDILVLDESSMIDSELMATVFKAMEIGSRIIIIGDSFQLPSVGPGNVLFDLIHSLEVPMVEFTKIYRQSEDSNIINYASALRKQTFELNEWEDVVNAGDIVFINEKNNDKISEIALNNYKDAYRRLGEEDTMLLSPVNKGSVGRKSLNREIQKIVNGNEFKDTMSFGLNSPDENDIVHYRVDDYITITENNYTALDTNDKPAMLINGDIGRIIKVKQNSLISEVEGRDFEFRKADVKSKIDHLWAITIHKSQGGQATEAIVLIPANSWNVSANMLYTAITRAKSKCYVIGDFKAINKAARKLENFNRKTMLSFIK